MRLELQLMIPGLDSAKGGQAPWILSFLILDIEDKQVPNPCLAALALCLVCLGFQPGVE